MDEGEVEALDVGEGRGAGSESDSDAGEEAILRFFLVPIQVHVVSETFASVEI